MKLLGPNFISTDLYERDIAIAPDGREIIYSLGNYKQTLRSLVGIKESNGNWDEKQILPFSGIYNDIEPFFSVDGKKLYFASNRPIKTTTTRTDYNIWVVKKVNDSWAEPRPLDTIINTENDEFYPSVSKNGTLYFTATREDGVGREDIFYSSIINDKYQKPIALDTTINSSLFEFNAYISPEEDLIIFSSFGREDDLGGGDLYNSQKDDIGNWTKAKNMGPSINSDKLDYCPFIDYPRGNFYFTSERVGKPSNKRFETVKELEKESNRILNGMGNNYSVGLETINLNE